MAPPMTSCFLNIYFDKGFDNDTEIIDNAIESNVIHKVGSWFYYKDNKLAQGKEGTKNFLKTKENKNIFNEIKKTILSK